jgi:elongator complex protein 3
MKRGHTVTDSIFATRIAKNSGLKVCYHLMPGLPGSDKNKDLECFQTVFDDQLFRPDMIKIYPTLTIKGTELYSLWKKGKYSPLDTKEASILIAQIKDFIPEWIRIQRIQRDVPSQYIQAGVDKSNLRQYVEAELKRQGINCKCIRCREFGHKSLKQDIKIEDEEISLECVHYNASDSEEVFLSLVIEKHDAIIGYLRLRDIKSSHRRELSKDSCTIIRELKVVGRELPIGERSKEGLQHKGFGKELINEAEKITVEEFDKKHLFVLSGVGVKNYYRNIGFKDNGVYLSKTLI